ncbi:hypothetical protein ACFQEP_00095 [Lactococcus lactis subsp. hordniae]
MEVLVNNFEFLESKGSQVGNGTSNGPASTQESNQTTAEELFGGTQWRSTQMTYRSKSER